MDRRNEIGPEEEAKLAIAHDLKQIAQELGLTDTERVQTGDLRAQLAALLKAPDTEELPEQFYQLITSFHELYQKIDEETSLPSSSQLKIAISLEFAGLFLEGGRFQSSLDELYDARTIVDQEEPRDEVLFEKLDALYTKIRQLIAK